MIVYYAHRCCCRASNTYDANKMCHFSHHFCVDVIHIWNPLYTICGLLHASTPAHLSPFILLSDARLSCAFSPGAAFGNTFPDPDSPRCWRDPCNGCIQSRRARPRTPNMYVSLEGWVGLSREFFGRPVFFSCDHALEHFMGLRSNTYFSIKRMKF